MFDRNKNYWLYIEPYVYCNIKEGKALLYNTNSGDYMETNTMEHIEFLQLLLAKNNLGAIYLDGVQLLDTCLREFVVEFCDKNMGNIVDVSQHTLKPIQMMPVLNLQRDMDKITEGNTLVLNDSLRYLLQLNIYINTACLQRCDLCNTYYKQSLCCHSSQQGHYQELDILDLNKILYQIKFSSIGKINIMGGDIFQYSNYNQLVSSLSSFNDIVHIWGHYANFNTVNKIVLKSDFNYHIVVTLPYDEIIFQSCLKTLSNLNVKYHFFFTTEAEYAQIEHLIQSFKINKYSLHPIFTGGNIDFFEQYIFNSKEDIIAEHKTFKEIFVNQKLNSNFFGSLTILTSGDIYANLNRDSLGNIINQEISKIINKELIKNTAWREIRNSDPCCKCLYQYLCPPPSNYEITINKHNLCLITL